MDPFENLKRELLVVTLLCLIALFTVLGLRLPLGESIAWLAGIGWAGALWLVLRTRRLSRRLQRERGQQASSDETT